MNLHNWKITYEFKNQWKKLHFRGKRVIKKSSNIFTSMLPYLVIRSNLIRMIFQIFLGKTFSFKTNYNFNMLYLLTYFIHINKMEE